MQSPSFRETVLSQRCSARIDDIAAQIRAVVESLIAGMKRLEAAAKSALAAVNAARSASGSGTPAFAGGGDVVGPGTGTSDSILALVSDGEFILQARAVARLVRRYGRRLLEFINRTGELPAFAAGGIVDTLKAFRGIRLPALNLPRFASGGFADMLGSLAPVPQPAISAAGLAGATAGAPSGGGRPVHLHVNNQKFPLTGDVDVVGKLEREIARSDYSRATGPLPAQRRQR